MSETRYSILRGEDLRFLELKVNEWITLGWIPQGGVCLNPGTRVYYQAMFKPN